MKLYCCLIITFCLSLSSTVYSQKDEITGTYTYTLKPHPTSVYKKYSLSLREDSSFYISKYHEEYCYNYTESLEGKWKLVDSIIHFYNFIYRIPVKYSTSNLLEKNHFLIIEKDFEATKAQKEDIIITAIDKYHNIIDTISSYHIETRKVETKHSSKQVEELEELYEEVDLYAKFKIPPHTHYIVYHGKPYFRSNLKEKFIERGLNIDLIEGKNVFIVNNVPSILNSSIKFKAYDNQLISINPIHTSFSITEKHIYKK